MSRERLLPQTISWRSLLWTLLALTPVLGWGQGVAITFDDLPLNGELPPCTSRVQIVRDVLRVLADQHLPPVYGFVNSKKLEGNADAAEALKLWSQSEPIGNHTYSHMDLHQNSAEGFEEDIVRNEPVLELLSGSGDWHWLRYPFLREGDTVEKRREVRNFLQKRGYRVAEVTLDYEDYLWNSAYARCQGKHDDQAVAWLTSSYMDIASQYIDGNREMARLVYGHDINHVLLLHLGAFSSTILPRVFALLKEKGLKPITLQEVEADPAYQADPDIGSRWGGTLLELGMDAKQLKYPPLPKKPYEKLANICK